MLIDAALKELAALESRQLFSYLAIVKKYSIMQLTLT
jgi:hypothetical protein